MSFSSKLDQIHLKFRQNKWLRYFAFFNRIALAAGFLPSGLQKILGERFTNLAIHHPMGNYLEAIHHTSYYYTFIGLAQVTAAILLLIPRTVTLGAILYFPIILNICILSFAVRFEGSILTSPLMVLANLYLLFWDFHKIKSIFPFNHSLANEGLPSTKDQNNKFPKLFFIGVMVSIFIVVLIITQAYKIMPRNTISDCKKQCLDSKHPDACNNFCDCIHIRGQSLDMCLNEYDRTMK